MPLIISHPETNPEIRTIEEEISVKKEKLANLISKEPGKIIQDYTFLNSDKSEVKLSELFKDKNELIIVFYMGIQCKYCTLWADNYNGIVKPLSDRCSFVVTSHESPEKQNEIKQKRNWNFKMISRKNNTFAKDLGFISEAEVDCSGVGDPMPGIASFIKKEDGIYLHHRSYFGPGDNYCNMWDFTTILPKGINNWEPKYIY